MLQTPIWIPSPNFNDRPPHTLIDVIVIHYTAMPSARASIQRLCDPSFSVSCHYLIDEDGRLYYLVEERYRAWHAGESEWKGRKNVNNFSMGIELQNIGYIEDYEKITWQEYKKEQMKTLVELIKDLCSRHPIRRENIVGHKDIAPLRKSDPGPHFNWDYLFSRL